MEDLENATKFFAQVPTEDRITGILTEAQKVEKYNCLRAFEICLKNNFDENSQKLMNNYLDERKKFDLQNSILSLCNKRLAMTKEEDLMYESDSGDDSECDLEEKPLIFQLEPSDFKSDLEYTRAVIKQVRRTH